MFCSGDGGNDDDDVICSSPASLGDLNASRMINIQDIVILVQVSGPYYYSSLP